MRFTTTRLLPPKPPGAYQVAEGYGALVYYPEGGEQICLMPLEPGAVFEILPGVPLGVLRFTATFEICHAEALDKAWYYARLAELAQFRSSESVRVRHNTIKRLKSLGLRNGQIATIINCTRELVGRYLKGLGNEALVDGTVVSFPPAGARRGRGFAERPARHPPRNAER